MKTGWLQPVRFVILALLGASILVVYLQHRSLTTLKQQSQMVLEAVSENAARRAANEIRRAFEGPVFVTLTAVSHPLLSAGRIDLVSKHFAHGLDTYPQVERFFLWENLTDAVAPGEVIFFGGQPQGPHVTALEGQLKGHPIDGFYRDREMGRVIYDVARRYVPSQKIYVAVEETFGGARYVVLIRLFFTDATRQQLYALLGYVVNRDTVPERMFTPLYERRLASFLQGDIKLDMRVLDETGTVVFGPASPVPPVSGRARFSPQFYPAEEIESRMAVGVPTMPWSIVVSPSTETPPALATFSATQAYWLSVSSVALIIAALAFAIEGSKRASQLAQMQANFVSHVSHQLKTPLALLSAAVETVNMDRVRSPEKLAQYLEIMQAETVRLTALVERILEYSRAREHGRRYEREPTNLTQLVRETVLAFQRGMGLSDADIRVDDHGVSPIVRADSAALEQALVNLLDNAVKYSDTDKRIHIDIDQTPAEAVVRVTDHGVGIAAADLPRVFDKFFRGGTAGLNRQGFGLGLAIAQELVAAHLGQIDVSSEPGRGSVFTIRLPLARRPLLGWAEPESAFPKATADRPHRQPTAPGAV